MCRSGEDHRSLPDVLRDLQSQLAGQEPAQVPGQSLARPLHVVLQVQLFTSFPISLTFCLSWEAMFWVARGGSQFMEVGVNLN